jgi:hypothetical protein
MIEEGKAMRKKISAPQAIILCALLLTAGCASSYKVQPLPFKAPSNYPNSVTVDGVVLGAQAFVQPDAARKAFGFNIRAAGMLPVQLVFDNQSTHSVEVEADQTFLEDQQGNLWPILSSNIAYERATKYAQTKETFKEGTYKGFLGAAAGSIIGAAIGIVTGKDIGTAVGKGAAVGAAAGATIGGAQGYNSDDARRAIVQDFRDKSLQNKSIEPQTLAHGILFFPGEATSAKKLRLKLLEKDTGKTHVLELDLS